MVVVFVNGGGLIPREPHLNMTVMSVRYRGPEPAELIKYAERSASMGISDSDGCTDGTEKLHIWQGKPADRLRRKEAKGRANHLPFFEK
jgi:hypothetical protein